MAGLPVSLDLPEAVLDQLADVLADRVVERVRQRLDASGQPDDGYLRPERAAQYLGVGRRRIYDLTSMGALEPDARDGRTPLYTRATLDAYARS